MAWLNEGADKQNAYFFIRDALSVFFFFLCGGAPMAICVLKRQSPLHNEYPHLNVATPTSLRRYHGGEQEKKKAQTSQKGKGSSFWKGMSKTEHYS